MGRLTITSGRLEKVGFGGVLLSTGALIFVCSMTLACFTFIYWARNQPYSEKASCLVVDYAVQNLLDSWRPFWNVSYVDRRQLVIRTQIYGSNFTKGYRCLGDYCIPPRERAERFARTKQIGVEYECHYIPDQVQSVVWHLEPALEVGLATLFSLVVALGLMIAGGFLMRTNRSCRCPCAPRQYLVPNKMATHSIT